MEEAFQRRAVTRAVLKWPVILPASPPRIHIPRKACDSACHRSAAAATSYLPSWKKREEELQRESFPDSLNSLISPPRCRLLASNPGPFEKVRPQSDPHFWFILVSSETTIFT